MLVQTHVLQHHDTAEQQRRRVGETLARNVGGRTVNGLKNGALITNVAGWGQTQTTDQTGAHVRQDITVQVGHDEDLVVVRRRVGNDLQARVVQKLMVELDIWEFLGHLTSGVQEQTVGHLHDGGLVHDADLLLVHRASVLEGETEDPLRCLAGNELDALDDTIHHNVLNSGVFTLGVLADEDGVDVLVRSLAPRDGTAWADVGKKVECAAQGKVQGNMAFANGSLYVRLSPRAVDQNVGKTYSKRTLERDVVSPDAVDGLVGDGSLSILQDGSNINRFPFDGHLYCFSTSCS